MKRTVISLKQRFFRRSLYFPSLIFICSKLNDSSFILPGRLESIDEADIETVQMTTPSLSRHEQTVQFASQMDEENATNPAQEQISSEESPRGIEEDELMMQPSLSDLKPGLLFVLSLSLSLFSALLIHL